MTCLKCDNEFDPEGYFWEKVGRDVTCPCCGTVMETDWDEGDDSVIGPWATKIKTSGDI